MTRIRRRASHDAYRFEQAPAPARNPLSLAVTVALLSLNPGWISAAAAGPTGGQVAAGAATIRQPDAQSTVVNQTTPRAVLNWQSFGIGAGESVIFRQPSSSAVALNRVVGPDASIISGTLQANGHIFLLNPSGVLFSKGASVDVGGLVASTLALSNSDFMAGRYVFSGGAGSGAVVNEGSIRAADGGYVALIGREVANSGTIVANAGSVALGAGDTMLLDFAGDGLLNLKVNTAAAAARIDGGGLIQADGGRVIMSAQAKNALTATALNVDGVIRARGLEQRNGEIFLDGGRSGITQVSGILDASSVRAGQKGGEIRVLGEYVGLFGNASLDASGAAGGGTILLGGDFQGRNPEIANAFRAYVGPDATIRTDAITSGDGGKVIVWADDVTRYFGKISARGGVAGGDGGLVEVSGKGSLVFSGTTDVGAAAGRSGTVLLDPDNISIVAGGGGNAGDNLLLADGRLAFTEGAGTSTIDENTLEALTGNVVLQATQDIVSNPVLDFTNQTTGERVVMQAGRHLTIHGDVRTSGAAITLEADSPHSSAGAADGTGTLTVNSNLSTNQGGAPGGDITLIGAGFSIVPAIVAGAGRISIGPSVNGTAMVLGSGSLNSSEIFQLNTSGVSAIGRATSAGSDGLGTGAQTLTAGSITVDAPLNMPIAGALSLISSGAVSQTAGSTITGGGALAVTAGGNVNLPEANNVTSFAASVTAGNSLTFNDTNALTITTIDGIAGVNAGGAVSLQAGGALTVSSSITNTGAAGAVTLAATGINLNADVTTDGGNVTLSGPTVVGGGGAFRIINTNASGGNATAGNVQLDAVSGTALLVNARGDDGAASADDGTIVLGATAVSTLYAAGRTIQLGAGSDVDALAVISTEAGAGFSYTDPNSFNLNSSAGSAGISSIGGATTNDGAIALETGAGNLVASNPINAGAASVALTAGGSGSLLDVSGVSGSGGVTLTADVMDVSFPGVNAGAATATLRPFTAGRLIDLGSTTDAAANTLELSNAELARVTAGTLVIGRDDASAAGAITVSSAISAPAGWNTLSLRTGASVIDGNGAAGADITATNLAIRSASGIGAGDPLETAVTNLAFSNTGAGGVAIANTGALTVGNVDGITAVNAGSGTLALSAASPMTIAADMIQPGSIELTAGENAAPGAGDDLTVNTGVTVRSTAGDVTLRAGDQVALNGTALVESTNGGGTVSLVAGFNDNDGVGAIAGTGRASAPNVSLDSLTGIGSAGTRFNTTAATLAARSTTGGGVFVSEIDGLTLNTIGSVANAAAGGAAYDVLAGGALTVSGPVNASGTGTTTLTTTTGSITVDAAAGNAGAATALTSAGSITGAGTVAGTDVTLDSATGVGAGAAARLNTAAGTLAARATASGGVFVNETDGVVLNGIGAVQNGTQGANAYDATAGGVITVAAPLANAGAGALTLNGSGILLGADLTTAGGAISLTGPTTLTANSTISSGAGAITFNSTIDGAFALVANSSATTAFNGVVGGVNRLASVTTDAAGTTAINTGGINAEGVHTTGTQTYNDAVTVGANARLSSTGAGAAGSITFAGTVESPGAPRGLGISTPGTVTFDGAVGGGGNPLLYLSVLDNVAGTAVAINGGAVTTTESQTYSYPVLLGANTVFTSAGAANTGAIVFRSTVQSPGTPRSLTINTAGQTALPGAVGGGGNPLLSVTTDAVGFTSIEGGVTTTGAQTYNDAVRVTGGAVALTSTGGGDVNLASTVEGIGGAAGLAINTAGATMFGGAVSGAALAFVTTDAPGSTAINGGSVTTTGAQTYNDAVMLGANTTLTSTGGGNIVFGNTLDGAFALTANTSGVTTFGGAVGGNAALASLATDAAGSTAVNGGAITTTGAQSYADALALGAATVLASTGGGAIALAAADGAFTLNVNTAGNTTLGVLGAATPLAALATDAAGSTTLSGPVTTSGAQTYGDAAVLGANAALTSTGAAEIAFASTLDGAFALGANTAGVTRFGAPVGATTALASLATDAPGSTALNGGAVTTTGAQTYNDAVVLGADATFTSTGGGDIAFGGSVSGAFGLTGVTSGTMTFGGVAAGPTVLASLTTDAGGSTVVIGGGITTTGAQTYNDPVMLGSDTTLMSTGAGDIRFNNTLNGGFAATLNTSGATVFTQPVGATVALAALVTDAAGTTAVSGGAITTTGAQTYNDAVTLGANTTLTSTGGGNIVFGNTLDGAFALAANTSGVTTFGSAVGGNAALASLATDAAGSTAVNGGAITTTGAQSYGDAIALGAGTTLTSTGGGAIALAAADGAFALNVNTAGNTTLGTLGAVTPLAAFSSDAGGSTTLTGPVTTSGAQTYGDAAVLGANAALTSTGAADIAFASTLDGAFALGINTAGTTRFAAPVGSTTALASLATDAPGTVTLNGGSIATSGAQTFNDALVLGANATLASTAGGAILTGSTVNGAFALAVNTSGATTFGGALGNTTALASLTTDAGGTTAVNGGSVTTSGAQTYGDGVTLGADTVLGSAGGGAITLGAGANGAFALAANTAGTTALGGPVGDVTALASLTTDAAGATALNGATVTTSGNQTYNDAVTLGANPTLASTSGNVTFASTVDADAAANNRALTVNASAGTVTFSGNVGASQALADLDVTAGPTTIVFNGAPSQTVNVSAQGGNTATFNGPVVLATNLTVTSDGAADNNVTFGGPIDADAFANARTLTVNSGTANTTFGAAVGSTQALGALSISAGQVALGGNVSVSGGGAVDLSNVMSVSFASGTTIDTDRTGGVTAAGDVRFNAASFTNTNAAAATFAIDASADNGAAAGDVTLGTIGNANRLDQLALLGDAVTFSGPVNARQVTVTANSVVTPTGQIRATQPFDNNASDANAALLLRGLSGPGQFGTRDAPIQIDAPGLFVVIPNMPNSLPFVFLAGDPNKSPVYQFANDPTRRRVFYNGAAPDSPADRAAQGAITQQLRTLLDELAIAGFAKENIRKQLLQGIVLETGLARPGIDEFEGEGVTGPASCEPDPAKAATGALVC